VPSYCIFKQLYLANHSELYIWAYEFTPPPSSPMKTDTDISQSIDYSPYITLYIIP
jgi:hypothetical protein